MYDLSVYRITTSAVGTFGCYGSDRDGGHPSGLLHDGTIVFGAFTSLAAPTLLGVLPSGTCKTVVFPEFDPIVGGGTLLSGAGDGFLYDYKTTGSGGTLTKYAY